MAGDEVEYPTEYMNTLANTRQTKWESDATEGVQRIRDAVADRSSFGDLPELAAYGSMFEEVRTIYLETMRGAKADLDAVAQGIRSSAQQMQDQDDQAGAAFVELWQRWENGPLESTRNHEQASSTESAQDAAERAESAQTAQTAQTADPAADAGTQGQAPGEQAGGTRDEGEIPTSDTPVGATSDTPPAADDDTSTYDATTGQPQSPFVR